MGEDSKAEMAQRPGRRRTVPVKHRDNVVGRSTSRARSVRRQEPMSAKHYVAMSLALVVALLAIAGPAHNYFEQRREMSDLESSIAAQEQRKNELQLELEQFSSPAYRDEQIRRRLGAIAQGETPFRIVDPAMSTPDAVTTPHNSRDALDHGPWYHMLWASVVDPKAVAPQLNSPDGPDAQPDTTGLPLEPPPAPENPDAPPAPAP